METHDSDDWPKQLLEDVETGKIAISREKKERLLRETLVDMEDIETQQDYQRAVAGLELSGVPTGGLTLKKVIQHGRSGKFAPLREKIVQEIKDGLTLEQLIERGHQTQIRHLGSAYLNNPRAMALITRVNTIVWKLAKEFIDNERRRETIRVVS